MEDERNIQDIPTTPPTPPDFSNVIANINYNLPDNNTQAITAAKMRTTLTYLLSNTSNAIYNKDNDRIVDSLTSSDTKRALSANQGKNLNSTIGTIQTTLSGLVIDNLTSTATNKALSANQGRILNNSITTLNNSYNTLNVTVDDLVTSYDILNTTVAGIDTTLDGLVLDTLSSQAQTKALSANQGYILNTNKPNIRNFAYADFAISDEANYDIVRFNNGHIKTAYFNSDYIKEENLSPDVQAKINSSASSNIQLKNYSYIDFAISDQAGYDIVRFYNGHIKTKNFDSDNIPTPSGEGDCIQRHKPVIIDTDWRTDVDDCVMVRCAQWAEESGMIDIIGYVLDLCNVKQLKSLSAFLDYEGRRGLAIGVDKNATNTTVGSWQDTILSTWPYNYYTSLDEADDAPVFYRKALKNLPAGKKADVVILGHCNAFARFLQSSGDVEDPRTGIQMCEDLIDTVYVMGGGYPSGNEHNFNSYPFAITGAQTVANTCPVKVVYLGYEVGDSVLTGGTLSSTVGTDDLLYKCLQAHGSASGRSSWDPMTMMIQIIGGTYEAGYNTVEGTNTISSTGSNSWTAGTGTNQFYVVKRYPDSWFQYQINQIIEKHSWPWRDLGAISLTKS